MNCYLIDPQRNFSVQHNQSGAIQGMAHSGVGLWISLSQSSIICLYHTETFRHLQNINIASNIHRFLGKTSSSLPSPAIKVTSLMASKGLLWVGTDAGIALSIALPRLEGVPIISGRANVSHHAHCGPITFFLTLQMEPKTPPTPAIPSPAALQTLHSLQGLQALAPSSTIHEESENESSARPPVDSADQSGSRSKASSCNTVPKCRTAANASDSAPLLSMMKKSKDGSPLLGKRVSRTLPRSGLPALSPTECDIFGLYGDLMNVKDYEGCDGNALGVASARTYETLRRSDPDLAAIPAKVSTLDRRLQMKAARPRSLDLSNWSVDSRSSLYTTSSGSEDSASHTMMTNATQLVNGTLKRPQRSMASAKSALDAPRTVFTLSGGRGYHYRKNSLPSPNNGNSNDAHIILWEMKL